MSKVNQVFVIILMSFSISMYGQCETKSLIDVDYASLKSIQWGVNIHDGGSDPQNLSDKIAKRNLKYVRMDLLGQKPVELTKFINAVNIMNNKNIKCTAILFTEFSVGRARTNDYSANLTEVEQSVYNDMKSQVLNTKDLKLDYELQNEIPLYPDIRKSGSTGQNALDYDTPAGRLQAAVLRGMYRAVDDIRQLYKLPIRIILGTVDRQFGFLEFMQQQGVLFDVVGYHIYPWEKQEPLDQDPWFGQGGPLGQLAKFNKPIQINEFNSGEIYSGAPNREGADYENQAGQPVTEAGFRSLYKHLKEIVNQKVANIEGVYFYEASDEPRKEIPENRFGLFYDKKLKKPKISLFIATAFAGGKLSKSEKKSLIKRGFADIVPTER